MNNACALSAEGQVDLRRRLKLIVEGKHVGTVPVGSCKHETVGHLEPAAHSQTSQRYRVDHHW